MNFPDCVVVTKGYEVKRFFRSPAAAMRAMQLLNEINEAGFMPEAQGNIPLCEVPALSEALARAESDDPPPHDGRPLAYPVDEE